MKKHTYKLVIESDKKLQPQEILHVLLNNLEHGGKSLAVVNWDTREAEGAYNVE